MKPQHAVALIRDAIPQSNGTWADLGAGDGTFTRALAELLGPSSRIYAVDRDADAVAAIAHWAKTEAPNVVPVVADFTQAFDLPGMGDAKLHGMLLANALHFVREAEAVLARLRTRVRPGGRIVLVEYDRRGPSPWVPHPIPLTRLPSLAASAGLSPPAITATRPSRYGGTIYVAAVNV